MPQGSSSMFEAEADGTIVAPTKMGDHKGRPFLSDMTSEEKIDEILTTCRALSDLIDDMFNKAQSGGMAGMLGMVKAFL